MTPSPPEAPRAEAEGDKPKVEPTRRYFAEVRASLKNGQEAFNDLERDYDALLAELRELQEAHDAMREELTMYQQAHRGLQEALKEIVRREARSEYSSIYAAPGEFAEVARLALAASSGEPG